MSESVRVDIKWTLPFQPPVQSLCLNESMREQSRSYSGDFTLSRYVDKHVTGVKAEEYKHLRMKKSGYLHKDAN